MTARRAWLIGLRTTALAPWLLMTLWLVNVGLALPAAWVVDQSIRSSISHTDVETTLREGFDSIWFGEYSADASGLAAGFDPTLSGVGGFLANLESWFTGKMFDEYGGLLGTALVFALLWAWLLGGTIRRVAFPEQRLSAAAFFRAGGEYFMRFLRLSLISALPYFLIYRLHIWLMDRAELALRDVTTESVAIFYTLLIYSLTGILLTTVQMIFGYAKVATVIDDRRSMLLAALRGVSFVVGRLAATVSLQCLTLLAGLLAMLFYGVLAPGAGVSSWSAVVWSLFLAQTMLVGKLVLRVGLLSGQAALYRKFSARAS